MHNFATFIELSEKDTSEQATKGTTVHGIHYSHKENLSELHGTKFGTGIRSAESSRLADTKDERIKKRNYFYNKKSDGSQTTHESGLGPHVHSAVLHNIFDGSKAKDHEAKEVQENKKKHLARGEHAANAFESAVVDSGYHGYTNGNVTIALNHEKIPVHYEGHKNNLREKEPA
jgi:hypothetical protein